MTKRIVFWVLSVLCGLLLVSAVNGQDVCIRDSVFPDAGNCGYDVQDYQLDMSWNLEGDTWDVTEVITFISEWDTDELRFDFTDSYEITDLSIDGNAAEYDREGTKLTVHYHFSHDTEYKLYAAFNGKLIWGELFDPDGTGRDPEDGFCMLNEPTNAWRFYICNDHPRDKATYHYSFTVPANYVPAGSGRLLMIREASETVILPGKSYERSWDPNAEGTVTFTYAQETQTAPYLFTVCAGAFDMKLQTHNDGKVQLDFVDREHHDTESAWNLTEQQTEIINALSKYFGEYPYEDLGAIVAKTFMGAALETQGRSLYDASTTSETVFAHEITHQWMGDLISLEDWSDLWIKEGAATYGQALWTLHKAGEEAYRDSMLRNYEDVALGGLSTHKLSGRITEDLELSNDNPEETLYDHEKAVKAIAALCQVPMANVKMKEGDVTFSEWMEALRNNCEKVYIGSVTMKYYSDMLGKPADDTDSGTAAGPKEINMEDIDEMYSMTSTYYGGSIVYHSLRTRLGDEVFAKCLQTLIEENKWGTVNEEKFIEVFSRVSGEDLSDFIKSYLYYGENGHVPDLIGIETWEEAVTRYEVK